MLLIYYHFHVQHRWERRKNLAAGALSLHSAAPIQGTRSPFRPQFGYHFSKQSLEFLGVLTRAGSILLPLVDRRPQQEDCAEKEVRHSVASMSAGSGKDLDALFQCTCDRDFRNRI